VSKTHVKKLTLIVVTVAALLVAYVAFYRWDFEKNHDLGFGYYGEYNRVKCALASIPGIKIVGTWANRDMTMEEFGFTASLNSNTEIRIAVGENDRIRSLSGDALVAALTTEIQSQVTQ